MANEDRSATQWRLPVIEETLQVGKRVVSTGRGVRVHKQVVTDKVRIEEQLSAPTVTVVRVPQDRWIDPAAPPAQRQEGDTLVIPVLEEVLVVEKRLRLREEIHITTVQHHAPWSQAVTLRTEQVDIQHFDEIAANPAMAGRAATPASSGLAGHLSTSFSEESLMHSTVVAIFDDYGEAQSAMSALFNEGFTHSDVKLSPAEESLQARSSESSGGIGDFFRSLFDANQHTDDAGLYSEAMRRGSYLLSIDAATQTDADRAASILERFSTVDIDQRASHWRSSGWTGYQSTAPLYTSEEIQRDREGYSKTTIATSAQQPASPAPDTTTAGTAATGQTLPVIEEQLQVGKRSVQRGGVRIYTRVSEKPVQESVQLREEHVSVERTPVDQPASAADLAAFKEGTLEIRETAEEPVVAKTARVVEEVRVGKDVTERTETVSDTVRRTDVEVEQLAASPESDAAFRQHWQSAYGGKGGNYDEYAPAYRYGATLASSKQYQGYRWDELEPQVKSDWEATHAGSSWDRTKQAVRYGWEKMTGR